MLDVEEGMEEEKEEEEEEEGMGFRRVMQGAANEFLPFFPPCDHLRAFQGPIFFFSFCLFYPRSRARYI